MARLVSLWICLHGGTAGPQASTGWDGVAQPTRAWRGRPLPPCLSSVRTPTAHSTPVFSVLAVPPVDLQPIPRRLVWSMGPPGGWAGPANLYGPEVKQLQGFATAVQVLTFNGCFGATMGFVIRKIVVFKRHQGRGRLGYRKSHFGFLKLVGVGGAQWHIHSRCGPYRGSCVHGAFHASRGPSAVYRPSWGSLLP